MVRKVDKLPHGIGAPEAAATRLGALRFFDGFPDAATVETLFDNLDFQRAVQSYLLGLAPVDAEAIRRMLLHWGPPNSTMAVWEDLVHPCFIGLIYNTSTSYCYSWLDLSAGPLVLEIPPGVYGGVNDHWCRFVIDVGQTGPDKGKGGRYLLLPPGYEGDAPGGYFVARPRTFGNWLAVRGFPDKHGDPHPAVRIIKDQLRVFPLADLESPSPMQFVNVSAEAAIGVPPADDRFWDYLHAVVDAEPPDSSDPLTLGMFASLGIRRGKPFNPDTRMRAILSEAATVGDATARALCYRMRQAEAYYYPGSAWRTAFLGGYRFEEDGVALLDSAVQLYFCGGATNPGMAEKIVGAGSQYALAFVDASGNPFDGAKAYRLHVPPNVPVNNFWSLLVYDTQTRSMLQTDQRWPSVTSQDEHTVFNPDGSVDIYFGPDQVGSHQNWIQTVSGKSWFAIFRLYGPLEPWFDRTWRLPDIETAGRV